MFVSSIVYFWFSLFSYPLIIQLQKQLPSSLSISYPCSLIHSLPLSLSLSLSISLPLLLIPRNRHNHVNIVRFDEQMYFSLSFISIFVFFSYSPSEPVLNIIVRSLLRNTQARRQQSRNLDIAVSQCHYYLFSIFCTLFLLLFLFFISQYINIDLYVKHIINSGKR